MADYPEAIDYFVDDSRVFINQNSHSALVLHGTGGNEHQTVEQLGEWFRSNSIGVSSHFGIGRDGRMAQYVRLKDGSAANCCVESGHDSFWDRFGGTNLNRHTLTIECINDRANSLPLSDPQKQALFKLVAFLVDKYDIPLSSIKSHASIAPRSRTRCPGAAFPWNELWSHLKSGQDEPEEEETVLQISQVGDYFIEVEKDKRWRRKIPSPLDGKTYDIAYGILDFYRRFGQVGLNGFTIWRTPITGELRVPKTKQAVIQIFRGGAAKYDPLGELEDEIEGLEGPCSPTSIDVGFVYECLIAPGTQILSNKVVTLQLELKRCLDTQNQEPSRRTLHQIYLLAQAFETGESL